MSTIVGDVRPHDNNNSSNNPSRIESTPKSPVATTTTTTMSSTTTITSFTSEAKSRMDRIKRNMKNNKKRRTLEVDHPMASNSVSSGYQPLTQSILRSVPAGDHSKSPNRQENHGGEEGKLQNIIILKRIERERAIKRSKKNLFSLVNFSFVN